MKTTIYYKKYGSYEYWSNIHNRQLALNSLVFHNLSTNEPLVIRLDNRLQYVKEQIKRKFDNISEIKNERSFAKYNSFEENGAMIGWLKRRTDLIVRVPLDLSNRIEIEYTDLSSQTDAIMSLQDLIRLSALNNISKISNKWDRPNISFSYNEDEMTFVKKIAVEIFRNFPEIIIYLTRNNIVYINIDYRLRDFALQPWEDK